MAAGVSVTLDNTQFVSQAGAPVAGAKLVVRNDGSVVDEIDLRIEGLVAAWVTLSQASVNLFPGEASEVDLLVSVPADAAAGDHPFRVVGASRAEPSETSAAECLITVLEQNALEAQITPEVQRAAGWASYSLSLRNAGNADRPVDITLTDPDAALQFDPPNDSIQVRSGEEAHFAFRARPLRSPIVRAERRFALTVAVRPEGSPEADPIAQVFAQLVQPPQLLFLAALPLRTKLAALVLVPLLIAAAVALWFLGQPGVQVPLLARPAATPTLPPVAAALVPPPAAAPAPAPESPTPEPEPAAAPLESPPAPDATPTLAAPLILHLGLNLDADYTPNAVPLTWDVREASGTRVDRSPVDTGPTRGQTAVETADYTLVASNAGGSTSETMRVYVLRPPAITRFATETQESDGILRVAWRADRATRVYLDNILLDGDSGVFEVASDPNHVYTLRAENAVGTDSRELRPTTAAQPTQQPDLALAPIPDGQPQAPQPSQPQPSGPPNNSGPNPTLPPTPAPPTPTLAPGEPSPTPGPPTPTPVSSPTAVPSTPTPAPAPTTIGATCPPFQNLQLVAQPNGSGIDVAWSASGGCAPYNGELHAQYVSNGFDRSYPVSTLTGSLGDSPPVPACGTTNQVNYALRLVDQSGQTLTDTASASLVGAACPPRTNPTTPSVQNVPTVPSVTTVPVPGNPTITATRAPTPGPGGWNTTDVTVTFTCTDPTSAITSCGPSPQVVHDEGRGQTRTGTATDAGGATTSVTVSDINIDRTAPSTTAVMVPTPNAQGWIGRTSFPPGSDSFPVSVTLTSTDALSGVASITYRAVPECPMCGGQTVASTTVPAATTSVSIGAEGMTTIEYFSTDLAGNSEPPRTLAVHLDLTPPQPRTPTVTTPGGGPVVIGGPPVNGTPSPAPPPGSPVTATVDRVPATIVLSATDLGAGQSGSDIAGYTYSARPGSCECPGGGQSIGSTTVSGPTATFQITSEGVTNITYSVVDRAGNRSSDTTLTVIVMFPTLQVLTVDSPGSFVVRGIGGIGVVNSDPAGISGCTGTGGTCQMRAAGGTSVTLTASFTSSASLGTAFSFQVSANGSSDPGPVGPRCATGATCRTSVPLVGTGTTTVRVIFQFTGLTPTPAGLG